MPQRFHGRKELSISFHVITGHYHSMIIIAHSSIHEFKKIFVNFTFRVRHICLNLKLNILLKNCEIFCLLEYLMKYEPSFYPAGGQSTKPKGRRSFSIATKIWGIFSLILILLLFPPSWLLVVGLIRERNNEIPTVAAAPFSSNSNKSPSFAINGEFVRIN